MMGVLSTLVDPYSMRARLQPALLTLLPPCAALLAIAPALLEPVRGVLLLVAALGGALLLSNVARDAGKGIEPQLWSAWGGQPSVAMLRHRDGRLVAPIKARYHKRLGQILKRTFPTVQEEAADPVAADGAYEAANSWMLANSRDQDKFQALFAENITYGFRRNLLGLRAYVLLSCAFALGAIALAGFTDLLPAKPNMAAAAVAAVGVAVYALGFLVLVRRSWVRRAAEACAFRLLETVDRV